MNNPISNDITADRFDPIAPKIVKLVEEREEEIKAWFDKKFHQTPPFLYNSVDIRHSGFKIAPVDTNMFPGGFNNLNSEERLKAVEAAKIFFKTQNPDVKHVLILAENHTRNPFYLENVVVIKQILEGAGKQVSITSLAVSSQRQPMELTSATGVSLYFTPAKKNGNRVELIDGTVPDFIVVNNDLTEGSPDLLKNILQTVSPPPGYGWYQRRKTSHFETYNEITSDFAQSFDLDPWLISTIFHKCGMVNFKAKKGLECVARGVEKAIFRIQQKYDQYGISQKPYVFIKSNQGTYGMGVMTATCAADVLDMNKDIRKKMHAIKGGEYNTEVIIQEGVPTIDSVDGNPAEPMIYLVNATPIGCMYRLNTKKNSTENLNSSGMGFTSMSAHPESAVPCHAVGLISRLAAYASSWECYMESYMI